MNGNNSLKTNDYYKNLNKHGNCSNCNFVLTQHNYKKGRTICRLCYNNNVLRYYKNKFCSNSIPKLDVGTQTDFSDELDGSNRQVKSKKHNKTKKQGFSNNNITDTDPNHLCGKLKEILSKPDMSENDYIMSKMILDELIRTKCISRKEYNGFCKNIGLL